MTELKPKQIEQEKELGKPRGSTGIEDRLKELEQRVEMMNNILSEIQAGRSRKLEDAKEFILKFWEPKVPLSEVVKRFPSLNTSQYLKRFKNFIKPQIVYITGTGRFKSFFIRIDEESIEKAIKIFEEAKPGRYKYIEVEEHGFEEAKKIARWIRKFFAERLQGEDVRPEYIDEWGSNPKLVSYVFKRKY